MQEPFAMTGLHIAGRSVLVLLLASVLVVPVAAQLLPGEYRAIDGLGNNPFNPTWGNADIPLLRLTTPDYGDGISTPAGATRPSARDISNACSAQAGDIAIDVPITDYVWQWGQFVDHDMDLTGAADPAEPFDIPVPLGDPWFDPDWLGGKFIFLNRSEYEVPATSRVRNQLNQITAFIDASNVYGSDPARAAELRAPQGLLKFSQGNLLPFNVNGFPNAPDDDDPSFFLAGDLRANEQNALTAMHTLFMREHNQLVFTMWMLGFPPELRYQVARAIVGAEMQAITYNEFLPVLLGRGALDPYDGYDPGVDPGIANVFSTACYRFGHSMLSPVLLRLRANDQPIPAGNLPLQDAFFAPQEIVDHGIAPLLRGLARQRPQQVDTMLVDDVRNFLFGPPGAGGFDLASLNLQRGRDHGLPGYNQARLDFGLPKKNSFAEVSSDPAVQQRLADIYTCVDEVDIWVGALAEDRYKGGLVGELTHVVLKDQFERLRDGDRFWYQNALHPVIVDFVESRTLARIIRSNTSVGSELQANVFLGD
ncbi:MAG: peroxidase family protein [Planctomycetota bacterium]